MMQFVNSLATGFISIYGQHFYKFSSLAWFTCKFSCARWYLFYTVRMELRDGLSQVTGVTRRDESHFRIRQLVGWGLFFSYPLYFIPHSLFSSYLFSVFLSLISMLLFPCTSVRESTGRRMQRTSNSG